MQRSYRKGARRMFNGGVTTAASAEGMLGSCHRICGGFGAGMRAAFGDGYSCHAFNLSEKLGVDPQTLLTVVGALLGSLRVLNLRTII